MNRILILGDINSPHIQKWVSSLVNKNYEIGVFSLSKSTCDWFKNLPNFKLFDDHGFDKNIFHQGILSKVFF